MAMAVNAAITGFGNPLLDITVKLNENDLLQKYNLNEDDQIEFDENKMRLLIEDIKKFPKEYTPGGSAQNTLRIFQWLCGVGKNTFMVGGIGKDENGKILKKLVESAGVQTLYAHNDLPTGISVALTNNEYRSLIAFIGAAEVINVNCFNKITDYCNLLKDVKLFYMEGFFIPKREEFAKYILELSKTTNILFSFNISAPYICKQNKKIIEYSAQHCNILFGNVKEYESLAEILNYHGSVLDCAIHLSKINVDESWEYKKIIVITDGSRKVVCIYNKGQICEANVPKVLPDEIQDTTGAGDSFVAGFLFGLFQNYTLDICLKYGCWTAQQIIKQVGCKVPNYLPEFDKV